MSLTRRTDRMYLPEEVANLKAEIARLTSERDNAIIERDTAHQYIGIATVALPPVTTNDSVMKATADLIALRRIEAVGFDVQRYDGGEFEVQHPGERGWHFGPTLAEALVAYDRARGAG